MPCRIRSVSPPSRRRMDAWKPDGSHRLLCGYGLVAQTVCCRDRPARLRGLAPAGGLWPPAALSHDRCVALAGSGSRAVAPWWLAFGRQVPYGQQGNRVYGRSALRLPEGRPGSRLRGCPRAGGRRRPRYAFVSHALAACGHAPEPRTGAPVQASVRRASDAARTGRSNVAARGGAGLVVAEIMDAAA